ncbi:MAG: sulfite exporter TauE/SafE family protein, partial [Bacteroidota bacterium]
MIASFLIGFFGSLHCVGMCGPIMMSITMQNPRIHVLALYHTGRISSYLFIGLFLGTIGSFIHLMDIQQIAVLIMGVAVLLLYTIPSMKKTVEKWYYGSWLYNNSRSFLSNKIGHNQRWILSGMANGFFPCGLTYIAAANATLSGSVIGGSGHMFVFGLGTVPALLMLSFSGKLFRDRLQSLVPRTLQAVGVISGLLLIYRGLSDKYP